MDSNYSDELTKVTTELTELFSSEDLSLLNKKYSADSWSVAQCIDHLIVSNEKYFPLLIAFQSSKHKMTFWERNNPFTKSIGKQMINTLGPIIIKKYQAPKLFLPRRSAIRESIINDFIQHQQKLISIIDKLSQEQIELGVITSPVAGLITLRLKDALTVLVVHEQRHLEQMKRIFALLK